MTEKFLKSFIGLGKLPGQYTIKLLDRAKSHSLNIPRCIAIPLMEAMKQELKCMYDSLKSLPKSRRQLSGMVVVPKSNGQMRLCVDLTKLNQSVCRERYPLPAVEQIHAQFYWQEIQFSQSWMLTPASGKYHFHQSQLC